MPPDTAALLGRFIRSKAFVIKYIAPKKIKIAAE
jgi:hypothetical protein